MFKAIIFSLATVALCQIGNNWWQNLFNNRQTVDTVHGLRVQYDDIHDLIIFIGRDECYLVEANSDRQWDAIIREDSSLHNFTEAIYMQIHNKEGVTSMTHREASDAYHSRLETWECMNKDIFNMTYNAKAK